MHRDDRSGITDLGLAVFVVALVVVSGLVAGHAVAQGSDTPDPRTDGDAQSLRCQNSFAPLYGSFGPLYDYETGDDCRQPCDDSSTATAYPFHVTLESRLGAGQMETLLVPADYRCVDSSRVDRTDDSAEFSVPVAEATESDCEVQRAHNQVQRQCQTRSQQGNQRSETGSQKQHQSQTQRSGATHQEQHQSQTQQSEAGSQKQHQSQIQRSTGVAHQEQYQSQTQRSDTEESADGSDVVAVASDSSIAESSEDSSRAPLEAADAVEKALDAADAASNIDDDTDED